jgi:hypothetical protein
MIRLKTVISKFKWYSNIFIPSIVIAILFLLQKHQNILDNVNKSKEEALINISTTLLGILLTILAIYISFPHGVSKIDKVRESAHHTIFIRNVITGVILYAAIIVLWLFDWEFKYIVACFFGALSNSIIATYYISTLSGHF